MCSGKTSVILLHLSTATEKSFVLFFVVKNEFTTEKTAIRGSFVEKGVVKSIIHYKYLVITMDSHILTKKGL